MAARAIWSGNFNLGMIPIPMKIKKSVSSSSRVSFRQINAETGNPIYTKKFDKVTDEEVIEVGKGYETKGGIVPVDVDEIKSLLPEKTKEMELLSFTPSGSFSVDYLDEPHVVEVDPAFSKAYSLLVRTMEKKGVSAVCKTVLSTQESLMLLTPRDGHLTAYTLRWADQMRDIESSEAMEVDEEELELAAKLIDQNTIEGFSLGDQTNEFAQAVEELIQKKVEDPNYQPATEDVEVKENDDLNLLAALHQSLAE